jgi:GNAT-family acetyltransferase (TIGR03103 family)
MGEMMNDAKGTNAVELDLLNPYARVIVDEALRRGLHVEILDSEAGYFELSHGKRSIVCRESLSELTTAIAMSRCDDKGVTRRLLARAGLRVPAQQMAGQPQQNRAFIQRHKHIVVKPVRGEQGAGISVDISNEQDMDEAIESARHFADRVLLEEYVPGEDLRVVVINDEVVAAAVRRPPQISGNGRDSVEQLIRTQSRRRELATGGESHIPMDSETRRCVSEAGYGMQSVLPQGEVLVVHRSDNLHTGATIHDVTPQLRPTIRTVALAAARAIKIPVVGLDFLIPAPDSDEYVIIEANERPGLANHEPQPTAERYIDMLFPETARDRNTN